MRLRTALADRYTIERELGAGGMATVYLALDVKHKRQVAVKVLREDLAASMGSARFLREIEIAAQLQHPHILPLLDSGDADGFLYYVMPYVKGQSLRERLTREGELPIPEAVRLITEVVDALALAHEHGVIHRDIKPDNVMLSGRHALVMDFGVAKAISEATGRSTVTTLGVALGTPAYMSPEQAAADPHVDHRTDIYAVGVMLYEMLTGRPPFTGNTPQQVLAAQVTEAPDPVSKRRATIPPVLEAIVMRCLAKRPADRFQTASELHAALEPLSTTPLGITPSETRPVAAAESTRSNRRWIGWFAATAVAVLVASMVMVWRGRHTGRSVSYDRVQLTTDGNAHWPAFSPDGRDILYTARYCDAAACRWKFVVQDLTTGSRQVLLDSLEYAGGGTWSSTGSWLGASGGAGKRSQPFGMYIIPRLGGAPTRIGRIGDFLPGGDTALALEHRTRIDTAAPYLRRFIAPWIRPLDSVPLAVPWESSQPIEFHVGRDGKWIAILWISAEPRHIVLGLHDRHGRLVDTLPLAGIGGIRWSAAGSAILRSIVTDRHDAALERTVVDARTGRFGAKDTVLLVPSGFPAEFDVSSDGQSVAYALTESGPYSLWTLQGLGHGVLPAMLRNVRNASVPFPSWISPDGQTIGFAETTPGEGRAVQWFAAPFADGAQHAITPSLRNAYNYQLTLDGRGLVVSTILDDARGRYVNYSVVDGHAVTLGDHVDSTSNLLPAGANGTALVDTAAGSFVIMDSTGRELRRFVLPDSIHIRAAPAARPDGSEYMIVTGPRDFKRLWGPDDNMHLTIVRVSLSGDLVVVGSARIDSDPSNTFWTSDGLFQFIATEDADTRPAIYTIPDRGGAVKRGQPEAFPDNPVYSLSADGRRGVMMTHKQLSDIWLIRNFGAGNH